MNPMLAAISFLSLLVALAAALAAWAAYRLTARQYRLSIAPSVEAIPYQRLERQGYYGIRVMNHGKGSALHVRLDMEGSKRGPLSGGPSKGTVNRPLRSLMADDWEMIEEYHGHESKWSELWGTITCVDIEGRRHESSREKGDEHWTHRCLGK